jgi:hypothetical protein
MDIVSSFCELTAESPALQPHAVERLSESLINFSDNQAVVQVAAFVIGEFATQDNGAIDALLRVVVLPQTAAETQLYIVTAVSKLAVRFAGRDRVAAALAGLTRSSVLEVQQRSGEMAKLLGHPEVCEEMLAPIAATSAQAEQNPLQIVEAAPTAVKATRPPVDDLLLLVLDDGPLAAPQEHGDLLGLLEAAPPKPAEPTGPPELFRIADVVCFGQTKPNPQNPRQMALRLLFFATEQPMADFAAEYQIAADWQITVQPADGAALAAVGGKPVTQVVFLFNPALAPLQLQVRMRYRYGAQPLTGTAVIRKLPE